MEQRDWVRWRFDPIEESPKFYVIFTNDESPGNSGKSRKPTISASRNGELCLKINGRARTNESYYYSVFVKHCKKTDDATCQPKVLDPIIYVR